jgi:hypothetical protein
MNIDELIASKGLFDKPKVKLHVIREGCKVEGRDWVLISFSHTPSEDVLVPFKKLLSVEGFNELITSSKPKREKTLVVPVGWTGSEVADALAIEWEAQGLEVSFA